MKKAIKSEYKRAQALKIERALRVVAIQNNSLFL